MINPLKRKYHGLYWQMAFAAAQQSPAERRKVGAVVVTPTGMISPGWNGTIAGFPNQCENADNQTLPTVIHAERNALDKMTRQGVAVAGSLLFVTYGPCFECAKSLQGLGLSGIYIHTPNRRPDGLELLHATGTPVFFATKKEIA